MHDVASCVGIDFDFLFLKVLDGLDGVLPECVDLLQAKH